MKNYQMEKLENYLTNNNYDFFRNIQYKITNNKIEIITNQIIVFDNGERKWDAICHQGSYGFEKGLIEIMGTIVSQDYEDDVEGYLTANEIIERLDGKGGGKL